MLSAAMAAVQSQAEVGSLLRQWRERRRVTQLELALDVSRVTAESRGEELVLHYSAQYC